MAAGREHLHIAPSLLSADFGHLDDAIASLGDTTDWLHLDIMDGHFVPNLTIGPPVVASLRPTTSMTFDAHLMITNPERYYEPFMEAGVEACTVHVEIGDTARQIRRMRDLGLGVGLAANPDTPAEALEPYLGDVDLVLCMTVFPGFGGQSFMPEVMGKVARVRERLDATGAHADLQVDGGIGPATIAEATRAGANVFVAGSAVFGTADPAAAVRTLAASAASALAAAG